MTIPVFCGMVSLKKSLKSFQKVQFYYTAKNPQKQEIFKEKIAPLSFITVAA